MGWLWTSPAIYTWLCRADGGWMYYLRDSFEPRWFFDWNTQQWLPLP
jgi:hypothetical protein